MVISCLLHLLAKVHVMCDEDSRLAFVANDAGVCNNGAMKC